MADFLVLNTNNSGSGSLRQALADAAAATTTGSPHRILFDDAIAGRSITLSTALDVVSAGQIIIDGEDQRITISGGGNSRLISLAGDAMLDMLTIRNMTLANGYATDGAVVDNTGATLILQDVLLSANQSLGTTGSSRTQEGGSAYLIGNSGMLSLRDVIFDKLNLVTGGDGYSSPAFPDPTDRPTDGGDASLIWNTGSIADGTRVVFGGFVRGGFGGEDSDFVLAGNGGDAQGILGSAGSSVADLAIDTNNGISDYQVLEGLAGRTISGSPANGVATLTIAGGTQSNISEIADASGSYGNDVLAPAIRDTTLALNLPIFGFAGHDTLTGSSVNDNYFGGVGNDSLFGLDGNDVLYGDAGDDVLVGGGDDDTLFGGTGNDQINGEVGNDTVFSGEGNDAVFIGEDAYDLSDGDAYFGGDGADAIILSRSDTTLFDRKFDLKNNIYSDTNTVSGDARFITFDGFENYSNLGTVVPAAGENARAESVFGTEGSNTMIGAAGRQYFFGDAGNDTLSGGLGNDDLEGGLGADVLAGGGGRDRALYSQATAGVTVNFINAALNTGEAAGDTFESIESVIGSRFDDTLTSGNDDNDLIGGRGNDTLIGAGGRDRLFGGEGDDRILGGRGNDDIYVGDGFDTVVIQANAGNDRIFGFRLGEQMIEYVGGPAGLDDLVFSLDSGNTVITSHQGALTLVGFDLFADFVEADFTFTSPKPALITLTEGADTFTAPSLGNEVLGLGGNDRITGGSGFDIIRGGDDDDTLFGADGGDTLFGDNGNDTLTAGGSGRGPSGASDMLFGGADNDDLFGGSAISGGDVFDGGAGRDRLFYSVQAQNGVVVNFINQNLNQGPAAGDTYVDIESITGTNFADSMTSGNDDNDLIGLGGNDVLIGAGGRDRLFGGNDDDRLLGGQGNDDLFGQGGSDTFVIRANAGHDRIFGFDQGLDKIEYRDGVTFGSLVFQQVGANVEITSANGVTTMMNETQANFTIDDFTFL